MQQQEREKDLRINEKLTSQSDLIWDEELDLVTWLSGSLSFVPFLMGDSLCKGTLEFRSSSDGFNESVDSWVRFPVYIGPEGVIPN